MDAPAESTMSGRQSMQRQSVIRVLVVDDHEVVAAGFGAVLNREPGFEVLGVATSRDAGGGLRRRKWYEFHSSTGHFWVK